MTNCFSDTAEMHLCGTLSALPSAIRLSDRLGHRGIEMQSPDRLFVHCSWCQSSSSSRVTRLLTRRMTINERTVRDVITLNKCVLSQNGYGAILRFCSESWRRHRLPSSNCCILLTVTLTLKFFKIWYHSDVTSSSMKSQTLTAIKDRATHCLFQ